MQGEASILALDLWFKAAHLIFIVTWFSGLFYLPRLFVYHADVQDEPSCQRFCVMEHKLYYYITWPSAVLATLFGLLLIQYLEVIPIWFYVKLVLVALLWAYHLSLAYFLGLFKHRRNTFSHRFYRVYNECPSLILVSVILLAVLQPWGVM